MPSPLMLRVAYLFPDFFFIGAQRAAAAVIRSLDRGRFEPIVFVIQHSGGMSSEIPDGVPIVEIGRGSWINRIRFFRIFAWPWLLDRSLREHRPDVVVGISPQTNFVLVLHRILFGRRAAFIGEEHLHPTLTWTKDAGQFRWYWRWLYLLTIRNYGRLDMLRCVSDSARRDFIASWNIDESKVCTAYPPFDLERIRSAARGAHRPARGVPVVCSVGRLVAQKNFALLLRAFRKVRDQLDCRLRIAGAGPEEGQLRALIKELDLEKDVELMGFVERAEQVVASADVFVMTSGWEGFPATLIEAMALGTPVVSVDCESGPAEIIEDGFNGRLVREHSETAIAKAVLEVLRDSALRDDLRRNALATVERFSLKAGVEATQRLIVEVSKGSRHA